jgi:hypothetical protein
MLWPVLVLSGCPVVRAPRPRQLLTRLMFCSFARAVMSMFLFASPSPSPHTLVLSGWAYVTQPVPQMVRFLVSVRPHLKEMMSHSILNITNFDGRH